MEDGIETYKSMLLNEQEFKEYNYVYIFIPLISNLENYKIFIDKNKAIEYSEKNNCKVEIFLEIEDGVYRPTNKYYENGIYK